MIKIFKKFFKVYRDRKNMLKEYDFISFLIKDSSTLNDFIISKKKIKKFELSWYNNEYFLKKLYNQYNNQLNKKRYYLSHDTKKKKKER